MQHKFLNSKITQEVPQSAKSAKKSKKMSKGGEGHNIVVTHTHIEGFSASRMHFFFF